MRTQKHPKIQTSAPGFLPAVTAALAAAGLLTSAHAQLQTAAPLLISVDATSLPPGPATGVPNTGTLGGFFEAIGGGANAPVVQAVNGNGTPGIRFDGNDFLQHVAAIGGAVVPADAGLVGANPSCTIEAWVLNPSISQEETVVSWGHRNGPDGSNMSFNYGWDDRWGSVGHWGSPDIGWDPCCNSGSNPPGVPVPGVWHHLVYTYDGTTQKVFSDGVLKNSENVSLNIHVGPPVTIAAQIEGDGVTVTGGLRGTMAIARLRVHDGALTDAQVASNYDFEKNDFNNGGAPLASGPDHRYRFNNSAGTAANGTTVTDSVGTAHGQVKGAGASFSGKRLTLPGGSSATQAYVDLPNGLISGNSVNNGGSGGVTLEGWVKVSGAQTWSRVFDIGSTIIAGGAFGEVTGPGGAGEGRDYWALFAQENNNVFRHILDLRNEDPAGGAGTGGVGYDSHTFGSDLHFAATWNEATGEMKIYENGSEVTGRTGAPPLSDVHDVNVWLGRSNWGGDANMQGDFDDFRIYNRVLAAAEVRGSYLGGPDLLIPANIISQPQSITVALPAPATFSVVVEGENPISIQWYRGAAAIPGANGTSYTLPSTSLADTGSEFHAVVSNTVGGTPHTVTSSTAVLTVINDNVPPTLVSARAPTGNPTQFDLVFSEAVNAVDAGTLANYTASGFTIDSIAVQNSTTVRFVVSTLYTVGCKTLTVNNIYDQASTPNLIAANSQIGVVSAAGGIRYEQFNDITGVQPADLINNPKFPNSPDVVQNVAQFENPGGAAGQGDNYGAHFTGFLSPPVSGAYRFYLSADDGAILYLSTDESPAHKVAIAREPIWSAFRAYNGGGAGGGGRVCPGPNCNISEPIVLQAGCKYFVEFIYKEQGGGDFGSVAWQLPGGAPPADNSPPISGAFLSPFEIPPTIGTDVADQTILDGRKVTVSADIFGTPPMTFQWYRDGVLIDGATGPSYTTDYLRLATDNGATFYVVVNNALGSVQSRTATITILPDNVPPTIVSAVGSGDFNTITLTFSEAIEGSAAIDNFNYTVSDGLGVITATLSPDGTRVTLVTDIQTEDTLYTVTVANIRDLAENPLQGGTISFRSFVFAPGFLNMAAFFNFPGAALADMDAMIASPRYPNNPNERVFLTKFDSTSAGGAYANNSIENYGARVSGAFVPPTSGNWIFYLRSDDASRLYLNPTGLDPAGRILLTEEAACCGAFAGHASAPQALTAGERYFIEAIYKEGGGGDYVQVAAKLESDPTPPNSLQPISRTSIGAFVNGVGASVAITDQPDDYLHVIDPNNPGAATPANFTVSATGVFQGGPFAPVYQWQRDSGSGFVDILNATGSTLSLSPVLADNGAKFRVIVSVPTATVTSSEVTLTVIQINTAPSFTAGPNQTVAEDSGAQVVPGWATDISVHSILRVPVTFASDFSAMPAGSRFFGDLTPVVQDGVLKLTDAGDPGGLAGFAVGFPSRNFESVEASWKSRVGGGGGGGADGYSFNVGTDLSDSFTGEEGTGTGLSVTVDTFDNGTGEDVGIDIKWRGARVGYAGVPKDDDGSGVYLRKDTFVDVDLNVSATGLATLNYDGTIITAQLADYTGVSANQFNFGARTGGANDNQWIDDLDVKGFPFDASSAESGQTVQFIVTTADPTLFAVQPAVSPDGTLSYTPAANAFGLATVTVVAKDNGGTAEGGQDTSAPSTFTITITGVNDCPIAGSQTVTANSGIPRAITLTGSDLEGNALQYAISQAPAHGTVVLQGGTATYTSVGGYEGPDSFSYTVTDGQCVSTAGVVTINVVPGGNTPPTAKITATPLVDLSPAVPNKVLISCNGSNALLSLDASLSSDLETPASGLTYLWFVEPSPFPFATEVTTSIVLDVGTHTILLSVTDDGTPPQTGMDSLTIDVITSGEAIEELITRINESTVGRKTKRPFIATLKAAAASADRGQTHAAANQLNAFQNKVRAQVASGNPADAAAWIEASQSIVDALNRCE